MQARVVLSIAARIGGRIICERFIELPDVKVSMWCDVVTGAIVCTEQALLVEERVEGAQLAPAPYWLRRRVRASCTERFPFNMT